MGHSRGFVRKATAVAAIAVAAGCGGSMAASQALPPAGAPVPADESGTDSAFLGGASLRAVFGEQKVEGFHVEDLVVGTGPSLQVGDMAKMHYVGRLADGHEFDSSRVRGQAFEITLGKGMVIKGFERGLLGMKIGGVRRITIPPELGYGAKGSPPNIPPSATLTFEIELLDIPLPPPPAEPTKDSQQPSQPQGGARRR